jgi:hypothetical protein
MVNIDEVKSDSLVAQMDFPGTRSINTHLFPA